mmetsp:Transcript_32093/g.73885  ORF Transcript_32093/g.73885 Transcript_32093/m.73885 type:complete len:235 (+) Transcript_32093:1867-2571(+)
MFWSLWADLFGDTLFILALVCRHPNRGARHLCCHDGRWRCFCDIAVAVILHARHCRNDNVVVHNICNAGTVVCRTFFNRAFLCLFTAIRNCGLSPVRRVFCFCWDIRHNVSHYKLLCCTCNVLLLLYMFSFAELVLRRHRPLLLLMSLVIPHRHLLLERFFRTIGILCIILDQMTFNFCHTFCLLWLLPLLLGDVLLLCDCRLVFVNGVNEAASFHSFHPSVRGKLVPAVSCCL